jgi:hypothetical protein
MSEIQYRSDEMSEEPEEKLEMGLRILGNEIFAVTILSQSKRESWIITSAILMVVGAWTISILWPIIQQFMNL